MGCHLKHQVELTPECMSLASMPKLATDLLMEAIEVISVLVSDATACNIDTILINE